MANTLTGMLTLDEVAQKVKDSIDQMREELVAKGIPQDTIDELTKQAINMLKPI